jgi:hypothetical protein
MKNKKLESTLENIRIIGRASVLFSYLIVRSAALIIGEEIKGAYYRAFKIPHIAYGKDEDDEFVSYIKLEK